MSESRSDEAVEELKKVVGKKIVEYEIATSPDDGEFQGVDLVFEDGTHLKILSMTCTKLDENRETCEELEITLTDFDTEEERKTKCSVMLGGGMLFAFDEDEEKSKKFV